MDYMLQVMQQYPYCIPFVIYIKDEGKHKERFAVRAKGMTLEKQNNKYIDNFEHISTISKWLSKKAENRLIPKIDNMNIDKSLWMIHSTIIRCLRKFNLKSPLFD